MGISVTALRKKLTGGGARPSLFYSRVEFPPGLLTGTNKILGLNDTSQSDISFFMQSATIPESTVQMISQPFLGRQVKFPSIDREFAAFSTTIINDEDYKIRHFFESWIEIMAPGQAIFDATSSFGSGTNGSVFGKLEVHQMQKNGGVSTFTEASGSQEEESTNSSTDPKYLGSYYFVDAFPISVGEIALDWSTQNQIETFTVNFEYQYWYKDPSDAGEGTEHSDPTNSPFQPEPNSNQPGAVKFAENWAKAPSQ